MYSSHTTQLLYKLDNIKHKIFFVKIFVKYGIVLLSLLILLFSLNKTFLLKISIKILYIISIYWSGSSLLDKFKNTDQMDYHENMKNLKAFYIQLLFPVSL